MFVTSASKVLVPGILNLLDVLAHDCLRLSYLSLTQADVVSKFDLRRQPKFGFAVWVRDMYVYPCFFSRKEE